MTPEELQKNIARKAKAYQQVFSGENAKIVLDDLNRHFNHSTLKKANDGHIDPHATIAAAGGREVLLYIDDQLRINDAITKRDFGKSA